jgi:hypothetical protein
MLASYADRGEAMAIQTVLEAHGIPSSLEDFERMPSHVFGIAGAIGRSVALYVLEVDAERASTLLSTLGAPENAVDEEALAAEAEAATLRDESADSVAPAGEPETDFAQPPAPIQPTRPIALPVLAVLVLAALLAFYVLSR